MVTMRAFILVFFLLSCAQGYCNEKIPLTQKIKNDLYELRELVNNNKPVNKNPLNAYQFENFSSRSYLYYYRALGNALIAKNKQKAQKFLYLNKVISDLKLAKLSPNSEPERIDLLLTDTKKELIELCIKEKNYRLVIDTIEQLPARDKSLPRFIIFYAYALFKSARYDDFKRLAAQYKNILNDEKIILSTLQIMPDWKSLTSTISDVAKPVVETKAPAEYSKKFLLENIKPSLDLLHKAKHFSQSYEIFKSASALYFSLLNKADKNIQEKNFLSSFQHAMYAFAPSFIDELIMAHWKQADLNTAGKLSRAFLSQFEGHALYPKTLYNLGRIEEDSRNYKTALAFFKQYIEISDNPVYLELARFRSAWVLHLAKKEKEAKPYFEEYVKYYPEGRYASTCEYFLLKHQGKAEITNFVKKYPLNIYSYILADEQKLSNDDIVKILAKEDNLKALEEHFTIFKADIKTLSLLNQARELLSLGLSDQAIKILKSFASEEKSETFALYLANQMHELKDTHGDVSNLIKAAAAESVFLNHIPWTRLFPKYKEERVKNILAELNSKLPMHLIFSIMRQESAFDPKARSKADAQGLMQLTKGTANEAARQLMIKDFSLFNEEDNLKLGIRTFAELLKKFDNRLDYALSAYNAGETPTRLWIKLRGDLTPIEFIESIPYPETRLYIKNILKNYAIYQLIYHEQPAKLVSFNGEA